MPFQSTAGSVLGMTGVVELKDRHVEFDLTGGRATRHWLIHRDLLADWVAYGSLPNFSYPLAQFNPFVQENLLPGTPQNPTTMTTVKWSADMVERAPNDNMYPQLGAIYWDFKCYYQTYFNSADQPIETLDISADMLNLGPGGIWQSDGLPACDQSFSMIFPVVNDTIECTIWESLNVPLLVSLAGSVNAAPFNGLDVGQALFLGMSTRMQWDFMRGCYVYRCQFKFSYKVQDWNLLYRLYIPAQDGPGWDYLVDGNFNTMYPYADFTQLGINL